MSAAAAAAARAALLLMLLLGGIAGAPASAQPLSVAPEGLPVAAVLDKFAARAAFLAGQAIGEPSLPAAQAARELQLMVANTRSALRDVAEERWDRLAAPQEAMLRALDAQALAVPARLPERGRIEDATVLDVAAPLTRLAFDPAVPVLRRVEGADQYRRSEGGYRLRLSTNLPALGATGLAVTLAGQPVPPSWLTVAGPETLELSIPAEALAHRFADRTLVHLPLEVSGQLPERSWKFWQSRLAAASFPFSLQLLPARPFAYALHELAPATAVDATRTLQAKGALQAIPGCGAPGCERDHNVCVTVPAGAKPLEPVFFTDQGDGPPEGGWTTVVNPQPDGVCVLYKQRSPTRERRVGFELRYHPLAEAPQRTERKLRPLAPAPDGSAAPDADALALGVDHGVTFGASMQSWTLVATAFTGQVWRAGSGVDPGAAGTVLRAELVPREAAGGAGGARLRVRLQLPW